MVFIAIIKKTIILWKVLVIVSGTHSPLRLALIKTFQVYPHHPFPHKSDMNQFIFLVLFIYRIKYRPILPADTFYLDQRKTKAKQKPLAAHRGDFWSASIGRSLSNMEAAQRSAASYLVIFNQRCGALCFTVDHKHKQKGTLIRLWLATFTKLWQSIETSWKVFIQPTNTK